MEVDAKQLAILADRFDRMTDEHKAMRESFDSMRLAFAKFESTPQELATLRALVDAQAKVIDRHSFVIKLCGFVLASCVGLIGWGWKEVKALYLADNAADRRLLLIEYKLNIPPVAVEGEK